MAKKNQALIERKYKDSIFTDKGEVRLGELPLSGYIFINGNKIRVSDIPWSIFVMECGHKDKGIAVDVGRVIFCDECQSRKEVVTARS
jgi:hypothetical protein